MVPVSSSQFSHQALIYGSEQEFADAALPFVREGIELGEPVLVAANRANVAALRRGLGEAARWAELLSVEQWYENPIRTRAKFYDWAAERVNGHRVRLIGEPPWPLGYDAGVRDWARHEAVINVAFAQLPVTFVCPYDARALPPSVIDHARATHPDLVDGEGVGASDDFADPAAFCRRLDRQPPARSGSPSAVLGFGGPELGRVRELVEREAARAGFDHPRARDLVTAVNEVATNALRHGRGPTSMRVWRQTAELVFEVSDRGFGPADPLAGQIRPDLDTPGGWGLWIARTLADWVEIRSGGDGTMVALHASTAALEPRR